MAEELSTLPCHAYVLLDILYKQLVNYLHLHLHI